jgi:IS30 family transposase
VAQKKAQEREKNGHKRNRLKSQMIRHEVEQMLTKGWSPELAAGRLRKDHPQWPTITHEAIYQWIYAERPDLIGYLTRAHRKRNRRWKQSSRSVRIPERVSIQKRPDYINQRQEPGHWESDLVVGSGRAALQVAVERRSRLVRIEKIPNKTALQSRLALQRLLAPLPESLRQSITYDNGSENSEHLLLNERLGTRSWFCNPYHSWEKGQVENTNGLIRRFVPKRSNLDNLSSEQIQRIETWLNDRPRKVLEFQTSNEVFKPWCCT